MDFFIHKLHKGSVDSLAHLQFEKYSRGNFTDKAIVQGKHSKDAYSFVTTSEYASDFIRACAEELGAKSTAVTGVVISTKPLPPTIKHNGISQFMGVKKYDISGNFSGHEIIQICDAVPRAFVALTFSTPSSELKIKPKAPKSAKPSSPTEEGPKVDFCKLKTTNPHFAKRLFFEVDDFKTAEARHTFEITDIEVPKNEPDPVQMREKAIRIGKVVRKLTVDGVDKSYTFNLRG
ncbi:MAG: hypothetical protein ACP5NS_02935 [Candidatus Pacearchaeota archaeon]